MGKRWILILAVSVATALPVLAATPLTHWGKFTVTPQGIVGGTYALEVLADGPIEDSRTHIRVVRTRQLVRPRGLPGARGVFDETTTADSRRCPVVHQRIAALRQAQVAQLKAPPSRHATLDGTEIGIDAPLLSGGPSDRMVLADNEAMDAIDDWISETVAQLKDCWKPES